MVSKAVEYIKAGDIFQVVLSQRFSAPFSLPAISLYRSLRRLNPPFLILFNMGDMALVGSSPEILVRLRDKRDDPADRGTPSARRDTRTDRPR